MKGAKLKKAGPESPQPLQRLDEQNQAEAVAKAAGEQGISV